MGSSGALASFPNKQDCRHMPPCLVINVDTIAVLGLACACAYYKVKYEYSFFQQYVKWFLFFSAANIQI